MNHRYATNFLNLVQGAVFQFRVGASKFLPRFVKRPFPKPRLQDIRRSDPEGNARHTPPADEYVDLCSFWAIEIYTPAHTDELLRCLESLGWTEDESRNPAHWLKNRAVSQFSQAWMPLGPVIPRDIPDPYITRSLRADLPPNVSYAYGDIFCFTPSLVAIAFEFVFDDEYSRILDDAMRQDRESYVTPIPSGYRIHDPGNQRISHIKKIRKDTACLITDWFSENIPGLCSAGLLEGDFPTCEFVTLRKAQPFPTKGEHEDNFQWYLHDLGLSNSHGSWESSQMPALRFDPGSSYRNFPSHHSMLAIHEASWVEQDSQDENGSSRESRLYRMHRRMSGMLGIWAIDVLLQGYAQHFRELRNSELLRSTNRKSAVEALRGISDSLSYSVDIAAVTDELVSLTQAKLPLGFEIEPFVPRPDAPDYWGKDSLGQLIHRQVGENARWLRSMDNAVRDHLAQYGAILGIVENISSQKKITLLTYAMLGLTVALAILTFITASERFPWVRTIWNSLGNLL